YLHHVLPFHLITHYRYLFLFLFSLMTRRPPSSTLFPYMTLFRSVLSSDAGHELYKHRKATVEPVFAQNKFNRGFRRFQRRGRAAVRSEWRLQAAVHNLLKLHSHWIAPAIA